MFETQILGKVGLSKLFLWTEAERIQTYPEAFVRLEETRSYSKKQLATDVFELVYSQHNKSRPVRGDQINNLFGVEKISDKKVVIRGINLLHKLNNKHYYATDEAIEIGKCYQTDMYGEKWAILLAKQIARYEVRTRLVLHLLGICGWSIVFPSSDFFAHPSSKALLIRDGEMISIFANKSEAFNQLLQEHRQVALGPWWLAEIECLGFDGDNDFEFEGVKEGPPATNKLNSNIKSSLFLMKYLGVIVPHGDGWRLSGEQAIKIFGNAIAADFTDVELSTSVRSPFIVLMETALELQDHEGFVVVSHLARDWASRIQIPNYSAALELDDFMREQMYTGKIKILERNQGQPRHGRGLFGEEQSRKIKLFFAQ